MLRVLLVVVAVALCGRAFAGPSFEDYPTGTLFSGRPAKIDLSVPANKQFRTRLTEGARLPPNFASAWRLVVWGCGTSCVTGAAVNLPTGRVVFLPFTVCCSQGTAPPLRFQPSSRLLVVNGILNEEGSDGERYFALNADGFAPAIDDRNGPPAATTEPAPQITAPFSPNLDSTGFPIVDVEKNCQHMAPRMATGGGYSGETRIKQIASMCVDAEQLAYDAARNIWPLLNDKYKSAGYFWKDIDIPNIPNAPNFYRIFFERITTLYNMQRMEPTNKPFRY